MSETPAEATPEPATDESDAPKPTKPTETVDFWKQKAREQETRAKANADAAKRLADIEESQKSEQQKTADAQQAAERRATDAEARALRLEVAFEKGLNPAQAKRLVGATRDELESDAEEILRDFPVKSDGRPKGDVDQGPRVTQQQTDGSPKSLIMAGLEEAAAARAKH